MTAGGSLTAVILAAGLGTRLRPLSQQVPKTLFPILNRPLLGLLLTQLHAAGYRRVAVNTHHLAADIQAFVAAHCPAGLEVFLSHEPEILGTGGGLRHLADFVGDSPFLVINGDILTDLDLALAFGWHREDALATLILHDFPRFNNVWTDGVGNILAFGAAAPAQPPPAAPLAFTGVQIVSPRLFDLIPPGKFVNIIDTYRLAIQQGETVAAAVPHGFFWRDIGSLTDYLEIHRILLAGASPTLAVFYPGLSDPLLAAGVHLGPGVCLDSGVCLGPGVKVGAGAYLKSTVVWAEAVIAPGLRLEDCVVGRGVQVQESARGGCFPA